VRDPASRPRLATRTASDERRITRSPNHAACISASLLAAGVVSGARRHRAAPPRVGPPCRRGRPA
jgi:hypothetical protein